MHRSGGYSHWAYRGVADLCLGLVWRRARELGLVGRWASRDGGEQLGLGAVNTRRRRAVMARGGGAPHSSSKQRNQGRGEDGVNGAAAVGARRTAVSSGSGCREGR